MGNKLCVLNRYTKKSIGACIECRDLLDEKYLPHGIVLLSSAMPRGIRYGTKTLRRIMIRYWLRLFTDEYISLTDDELLDLVRPVPDSSIPIITRSQPQTATAEARKLAFYPDKLKPVRCHCSIIYGDKDQWINPNSQETLARNIRTVNRTAGIKAVVTTNRIPGAGHLSLFHGTTAIDYICRWCVY
jgi:pimeloyl-ACP methyl ester carboxylesterase